jgi:phosphate starvation-inducible membrane PsiE
VNFISLPQEVRGKFVTKAAVEMQNNLFFLIIMLVKYVSIDGIPQTFVFFRFVDIIVITVHDRF